MKPTTFNAYSAYVQGMITEVTKRRSILMGYNAFDYYLQDHATIGFRAPRQLGATAWLHQEFLSSEKSLLIVPTPREKDAINGNYTRDGEYIEFMQSIDDETQRGLSYKTNSRILTIDEVLSEMRSVGATDRRKQLNLIDRVYIQNSDAFFKQIRRAKFYTWLASCVLNEDGFVITN